MNTLASGRTGGVGSALQRHPIELEDLGLSRSEAHVEAMGLIVAAHRVDRDTGGRRPERTVSRSFEVRQERPVSPK